MHSSFPPVQNEGFQGPRPPMPPRVKSMHERYIEQKAEEVSQSENVDLTANIHGYWNMENCKKELNEFSQKRRLPPVVYQLKQTGNDNSKTFIAEASIFLADVRKSKESF